MQNPMPNGDNMDNIFIYYFIVLFEFQVKADPNFTRKGRDIHSTHDVDYLDAILGDPEVVQGCIVVYEQQGEHTFVITEIGISLLSFVHPYVCIYTPPGAHCSGGWYRSNQGSCR